MEKQRIIVLKNIHFEYFLNLLKLLCAFLLFMGSYNCYALEMGPRPNDLITLNVYNKTIREVFSEIEKQSSYAFLYSPNILDANKKVSVRVKNQPISKVLDIILKSTDCTYSFSGKQILIKREKEQKREEEESSVPVIKQRGRSVRGAVVDNATGETLIGVAVRVKGTQIGTVSDIDGSYNLSGVNNKSELEISYVGYKSQIITVGDLTTVNIRMTPSNEQLGEVVVVGYGTQKKIDLTGSIASVSDKGIQTSTNVSLIDKLAGKIPGLMVLAQSSEPGDYSSSISIRGWTSPLVIVDGVQRSDYMKIDPNEIASVTVLKDASAAIYGIKASNGVILITTKKGETGKPEVTYSYTLGYQRITSFPKPMNAWEYAYYYDCAEQNSGVPVTYSLQQIADYKSGKLSSTNWWDIAMNNSASQEQHNLTFSGGNQKIKYFNSLGYITQDGLYKSGDLNYHRFNFRSDITAQIANNLDAEVNISGLSDDTNSPAGAEMNVFKGIWMQIPTLSLYANNNSLYLQNMPDGNNPYAVTHSSIIGYNDTYNKSFDGSLNLNYKVPFLDGLKASFFYDYYLTSCFNKTFNKQYTLYDYDASTKAYSASSVNSPSNMSESYSETKNSTMDLSLNYEKTIAQIHHIKGLLLFEKIDYNSYNLSGTRQFTVDALDQMSAGNTVMTVTGNNDDGKTDRQSLVGRINYDYASKYLFEFSFREDGSSLFPKGHRWGFFPGVSLGWRLSEEGFIKNNLPFVSNLKLRGSWGKMGDDSAASFQYVDGYNYPSGGYVFGGTYTSGLSSRGMTNPNITWYTSTTSDIGIDANLWNQKLNFTFDAYQRKRTNLLGTLVLSLPQTVGASLPQMNINSDVTRGFDLSIGTFQKINDFQFGINAQMSSYYNKNLHQEQAAAGNSYLNWTNNSNNRISNVMWGYKVVGHFTSQAQIDAAAIEDGNGNKYVKIGDLQYLDKNHDGVINSLDEVPLNTNNSYPEISYGVNFTLGWKGFDASVLFQGAANVYINLQNTDQLSKPFPWGRNGLEQFTNVWHQADPTDANSAWIPGKYAPSRISGVNPNDRPSTYYIKNDSYLRLKSIEIGYTVPEQLLKKVGIQKLRFFANGFNVLTWSKLPYMDPEHPSSTYGYLYPITKNFNFGLNVSF